MLFEAVLYLKAFKPTATLLLPAWFNNKEAHPTAVLSAPVILEANE